MRFGVKNIILMFSCLLLASCGFHLQGPTILAPRLHSLYLQSNDPYGVLSQQLKQSLSYSKVKLADNAAAADTTLTILSDNQDQQLLSVSGTQQTRQYRLIVTVVFELSDQKGQTILSPQVLTESRILTMQSSQILASSNESNLLYQQMRRALATTIMYRLASQEVTDLLSAKQVTDKVIRVKHKHKPHS